MATLVGSPARALLAIVAGYRERSVQMRKGINRLFLKRGEMKDSLAGTCIQFAGVED